VKRYSVRFTAEAEDDLLRLYDFLLEKDIAAAERALAAITAAIDLLQFSPFSCRKAVREKALLRELVIPFGSGRVCSAIRNRFAQHGRHPRREASARG
jgi:plasmid stabilization system protein ParE